MATAGLVVAAVALYIMRSGKPSVSYDLLSRVRGPQTVVTKRVAHRRQGWSGIGEDPERLYQRVAMHPATDGRRREAPPIRNLQRDPLPVRRPEDAPAQLPRLVPRYQDSRLWTLPAEGQL